MTNKAIVLYDTKQIDENLNSFLLSKRNEFRIYITKDFQSFKNILELYDYNVTGIFMNCETIEFDIIKKLINQIKTPIILASTPDVKNLIFENHKSFYKEYLIHVSNINEPMKNNLIENMINKSSDS